MTAKKPSLALPFVVVLSVTWVPPAYSCGEDDVLEEVRAGNQAVLDSIRTLYCRITKSSPTAEMGAIPAATGEWWGTADSRRVRSPMNGGYNETVSHDGTLRSITKGRQPNGREGVRFHILRANPDEAHGRYDAWGLGLLKLAGPKGWPLTLAELSKRSQHRVGRAERAIEDGRECIVVPITIELSPGTPGDFKIWFDPQVNYLARKLTGTMSENSSPRVNMRRESVVLRFREVAPTLFFPERAETRFYADDKLVRHDVVEFSEIRVNEPLPAGIFELPIPPGAEVFDEIQDQEYKLDAQGKQVGPSRPLVKFAPLSAGAAEPTATREEPRPVTRWIVPGSLLVLIVAGGLWLLRKWLSTQ